MPDNFSSAMDEKDTEFDQLREESRQAPPPVDGAVSSPAPPDTQTPPSSKEPEKKEAGSPDLDLKNWVPLAAHLEEKKARQRLDKLVAETQEKYVRLEERFKLQNERATVAPEIPDRAQDPVGYLEYQTREAKELATKAQEPVKRLTERLDSFEQNQRLATHVGAVENDFATKQPDYWNAVEHIRKIRTTQYVLAGLDEAQQAHALNADTNAWIMALLHSGKNPAEATFELAKAYGYSVKAEPGSTEGNVVKFNPKVEEAKEKIKTVERGQQASKSLGEGVGGSPPTKRGVEDLALMDDDEFDKLSQKDWKKFWTQ